MDLLQAAVAYAQHEHKNDRFKYVEGVYFEHVKAVSARMRTLDGKIVALLHDVVEHFIKRERNSRQECGRELSRSDEEALIAQKLDEINAHFMKKCSISIRPLLYDVDVLTKRTWDTDYPTYIRRIAAYAMRTQRYFVVAVKRVDLDDNSLPKRNPPATRRSDKDINRLARYDEAKDYLTRRFRRYDIHADAHPRSSRKLIHNHEQARYGPRRQDRRRGRGERLRERFGSAKHD